MKYLRGKGGRWGNDSNDGSKTDTSSTYIGTLNNSAIGSRDYDVKLTTTVEYVKQTLEWPDIPGGSYQAKGNYDDMTIFGIKSTTGKLMQNEDTNYIIQVHAFVNYGVYVDDVRTQHNTVLAVVSNLINCNAQCAKDRSDVDRYGEHACIKHEC